MRRLKCPILLVLGLAACVAPPAPESTVSAVTFDNCGGQGLISLAMEDGMNGLGEEAQAARLAACHAIGATPDPDRYAASFADGVARYCTVENAYRLGRNGAEVIRRCPAHMGVAFDDSYQRGLLARDTFALVPYVGLGVGVNSRGVRPIFDIGMWF